VPRFTWANRRALFTSQQAGPPLSDAPIVARSLQNPSSSTLIHPGFMVTGMGKTKIEYICNECGTLSARWTGRCGRCGSWNSVIEYPPPRSIPSTILDLERSNVLALKTASGPPESARLSSAPGELRLVGESLSDPVYLDEVPRDSVEVLPTGVPELDRVLGGGLVLGSVTLLGGEPGIGKSTLVLQALGSIAKAGRTVLLHSAEESPSQIRARAERIGFLEEEMLVFGGQDLEELCTQIAMIACDLGKGGLAVVAVDSVQMMRSSSVDGQAGTVSQVRAVASKLGELARYLQIAVVLVGHVTKDGSLAGPKTLEHLVDTVLSFEGDRRDGFRTLRALKHRFGRTGEVGMFEMGPNGLCGLENPGRLWMGDRIAGAPGTVLGCHMEGSRALIVEIQALVVPWGVPATSVQSDSEGRSLANTDGRPSGLEGRFPGHFQGASQRHRVVQGLEPARVAMCAAVLQRHAGLAVGSGEMLVSVVGGLQVSDPALDLAVALALASSYCQVPLPLDLVALGEIGLGGEIRRVRDLQGRIREAERFGCMTALVPKGGSLTALGTGVQSEKDQQRPVLQLEPGIEALLDGKLSQGPAQGPVARGGGEGLLSGGNLVKVRDIKEALEAVGIQPGSRPGAAGSSRKRGPSANRPRSRGNIDVHGGPAKPESEPGAFSPGTGSPAA
jgi:DNA repair protein RadA/Sms